MTRVFEYFVVCGIGPEIRSLDGNKGFQGTGVMYMPAFLDQFPPTSSSKFPPPPPPQLPTVSILSDFSLFLVKNPIFCAFGCNSNPKLLELGLFCGCTMNLQQCGESQMAISGSSVVNIILNVNSLKRRFLGHWLLILF